MRRIRELLLTQYIGAIVIGMLIAQALMRVIGLLMEPVMRNVMLLDGPPDTLVVAVFTAVQGLALIAIGLGIGIRLVPHAPHE